MRGFRGTHSGKPSTFGYGFVWGLLSAVLVIGGGWVIQWAQSNPVAQSVMTWATTPQITPLDVLNVLLIGVMILVIIMFMTVFRGGKT